MRRFPAHSPTIPDASGEHELGHYYLPCVATEAEPVFGLAVLPLPTHHGMYAGGVKLAKWIVLLGHPTY